MNCCGQSRSFMVNAQAAPAVAAGVIFEYVGRTGLTIIGPGSRTSYRFEGPGARVVVDSRDRASLGTIPVLRQVGR